MTHSFKDQPRVYPLSPTIGAEIEGIDLTKGLNEKYAQWIHKALLKYLVIFFEIRI